MYGMQGNHVMVHEATFRFLTPHARQIFAALAPELCDEVNPRSRIHCQLEEEEMLVLIVNAQDTAALRAALNMFLRLINIANEMQDIAESSLTDYSCDTV
jgi:KEOPS complex subunit Pcc1